MTKHRCLFAWPGNSLRDRLAEFSGDPFALQTKAPCNTLHLSSIPLFLYLFTLNTEMKSSLTQSPSRPKCRCMWTWKTECKCRVIWVCWGELYIHLIYNMIRITVDLQNEVTRVWPGQQSGQWVAPYRSLTGTHIAQFKIDFLCAFVSVCVYLKAETGDRRSSRISTRMPCCLSAQRCMHNLNGDLSHTN